MRSAELCRRCGIRLDAVHIAADDDLHPVCHRDPLADDLALQRALRVVADVFPSARRIREEQP